MFLKLFEIITSEHNRVLCSVIFFYFFIMSWFLLHGAFKIKSDMKDVMRRISKSRIYRRSEASKTESFMELDSIFNQNITLHHVWSEFKEGLVCEKEEFEKNGQSQVLNVYKNSREAEHYFNYDSVVINSERWKFGIKSGMFEACPNILTGLGIFGTFVGIVLGLPESLSGDITGAMENFIGGMKVAFGTSILGLMLALIFTIAEKWSHDSLEQCINKIASDIDFLFIRKSEQEYLNTIAIEIKNNNEAIFQMSDNIGANVAKGFQSLGVDSVKINESLQQGVEKGFQALSQNLNEIIAKQEILHHTAGSIIEVLGGLKNNFESANDLVKTQNSNFLLTGESLGKITKSLNDINQTILPNFEANIELAKDLNTFAGNTDQVLNKLISEKEVMISQYNELHITIQGSIKELGSVFDTYQVRSNGAIEGSLGSFDKELAKGIQRLSSVLFDMSSLGQDIKNIHEELKHSIQGKLE